MLGIRAAWRGHPVSSMAFGALLTEAIALAGKRGWKQLEISWILEHNHAMRQAMARLGSVETGRWRLWGAALPWPLAAVKVPPALDAALPQAPSVALRTVSAAEVPAPPVPLSPGMTPSVPDIMPAPGPAYG
jgi:hypothetical protein